MFERSSGVLLHATSLPGKFGIGTLGKEAYQFVDFLIKSNQKLWQTYPLGPTGYGDSPYQCFSAFAGNPLLISLETVVEDGLLTNSDLETNEKFDESKVDFGKIINFKFPILKKAFDNFSNGSFELEKIKFETFVKKNSNWLDDFSLFMSLKEHFGGKPWIEWDNDIKLREENALRDYKNKLKNDIEFQNFIQYLFFKQWKKLKAYANQNYIKIVGDIPIFVAFDSADAWSNPDIFLFDEERKPVRVAGVPPDYFSATGQLWGNPLYNWDKLKETNFAWWIDRIKANLELSDIIRIDHFRGFAEYWAVPYGDKTAINGEWWPAPGKELFEAIEASLGSLPIIAEDLGLITPDVEELRDHFNLPGMKILQFAFDSSEENNYIPHSYNKNCVVYTGTHDNDTVAGWFEKASKDDKKYALDYFNSNGEDICWDFIRGAWASTAVIAITPLQDILRLGSFARINTPGVAAGNWQWRFKAEDITNEHISKLKHLTTIYGR
ncbi:4-alpha-glucanotransferase [Haliovirga abyssi]|uniref:4-alpha-glucanotransferase n=2 Tax=Haliovirga abyssi TaxID=2996794 RepID=A0AAU9DVB3_9FUSO|nr:4-alpha-glucanotransferase [Haliovirga abyssi]